MTRNTVHTIDTNFNSEHQPKTITETFDNIIYTGVASANSNPASEVWQIKREYIISNIRYTDYALGGLYKAIWDNRTSYFAAPPEPPFSNTYSTTVDGVNDYLLGNNLSELTTNYTISLWAKFVNIASANEALLSLGNSTTATPYKAYIQRTSLGKLAFGLRTDANISADLAGTTTLAANTWYHLVGVRAGSLFSIYINGIFDASLMSAALGAITTNQSSIGAFARNTIFNFSNAKIDEVSVWSTDFASLDVAELYNSGNPSNLSIHSKTSSLVSWWRMGDSDLAPTITDLKSGHNMTMINLSSPYFSTDVP